MEFRQKSRGNFFFRFWTRFDSLLAILLVLGGTAYAGEPDQKDWAKIWNLTKNHQNRKKSNSPSKCAEFRQKSRGNLFFSILDLFWPTFGHFTGSGQYSLYRGAGLKRLSKNLKFNRKITKSEKNQTYHQNVRNFARNPAATFFSLLDPFWPTFGHFTSSGR